MRKRRTRSWYIVTTAVADKMRASGFEVKRHDRSTGGPSVRSGAHKVLCTADQLWEAVRNEYRDRSNLNTTI